VTRLVKVGLLHEAGTVAAAASPARRAIAHDRPEMLSPAQASALGAISAAMREGRHETILLFGVTGSGKTEVYLQAVEETISFGRQAIVLVPEISLTPQTCDRFRARFGTVAVLHSHLTPAERHGQWREIAAGRVNVVVGARSAIFAPAPRLGLVVIDEEHESSFKQATAPRYHARDVAEWIAREEGVPLVLGPVRRGVFIAVGLCVGTTVLFFIVVLGAQALAMQDICSPSLGAWLPLLVLAPLAAWRAQPMWQ
jgi:primosomal protein N'